jgi:hypothetical protein
VTVAAVLAGVLLPVAGLVSRLVCVTAVVMVLVARLAGVMPVRVGALTGAVLRPLLGRWSGGEDGVRRSGRLSGLRRRRHGSRTRRLLGAVG